jgi:hypothetical protein
MLFWPQGLTPRHSGSSDPCLDSSRATLGCFSRCRRVPGCAVAAHRHMTRLVSIMPIDRTEGQTADSKSRTSLNMAAVPEKSGGLWGEVRALANARTSMCVSQETVGL